jgi:hypothetical protein
VEISPFHWFEIHNFGGFRDQVRVHFSVHLRPPHVPSTTPSQVLLLKKIVNECLSTALVVDNETKERGHIQQLKGWFHFAVAGRNRTTTKWECEKIRKFQSERGQVCGRPDFGI